MEGGARYALLSLLMVCTAVQAAETQRAPETFAVSIDRQPLDGALQQLASQCGVQMIFFSRVTEGLSAPALEGNYTLAAATERLLAGSGLTFRVINPQTVEVRPLQAKATDRSGSRQARATNQAQASSNESTRLEEVVVVGLAEQLVATRIATPLREIPQTISIVTREQMRQRNEFSLADVLEHAPGITMARTTSLDQDFYARGYQITSFHIDGGAAINPKFDPSGAAGFGLLYLGTPDLVEFDHVEILRGADALFSGNANPGGTISLVRKRPQPNFAFELNAAAGSWDGQRIEMDITGPIGRDGALRGRAAAVFAHDGYFYDTPAHERQKVFAAFEYDFTARATLTAGTSYQWDEAPGVGYGLPMYADGRDSRLPRATALHFDWARYRSELGGIYLQYRQDLVPGWALKLNASGWRTEAQFVYGDFGGSIDPITNESNGQRSAGVSTSPNIHTQKTADVTLTGTLDWFGWREEVAIGGDFTRLELRADYAGYVFFGEPLLDPRAFDPRNYPDPRLVRPPDHGASSREITDQYGMFASLRIYFDDAWSIAGGARLSGDSTEAQVTLWSTLTGQHVVPRKSGTDRVVTPYAAVMYALDRHYSLYASYADIYRAQSAFYERAPGDLLDPVRGVNLEAGIKGEWRNGALNGSLALYQIEQSHLPVLVSPVHVVDLTARDCCYDGLTTRSRGMDAELSGAVLPGWNIGAGYTYNLNQSPSSQPLSRVTPHHLLKAWTNVRLPGALRRWHVGGSVHAQSRTTTRRSTYCPVRSECIAVEGVQPAYAVFDLRAGFDVDRHWRVGFSLNNVFDKVYYETLDLRAWYGEPRNWMFRIDGRY